MTEETQQEHDHFDLHAIFNGKSNTEAPKVIEEPKEKVGSKKSSPIKEEVSSDDEDVEEEQEEKPSKEDVKVDDFDYKAELEKTKKTLKDTQRSFHEDRKKLASYKKAVEKLKEDGALLDEEAALLLDHTNFESDPEEESEYLRYHKIWNQELQYMRKYASNAKEIDQNFMAFQHFVQTASQQEIQEAFADLRQYEDDEVEFTKQMLEIGRQYNEDIYSDINEVGSIRHLKAKYSKKESELQKEIDKLKKQVNKYKEQYEDYDTSAPNLNLPKGSIKHDLPKTATFDVDAIFAERNARHNQRR